MLTGIIRKMEKGIVTIPKMFRQALGIKENDNIIFEIDTKKGVIIIKPDKPDDEKNKQAGKFPPICKKFQSPLTNQKKYDIINTSKTERE